MRNAPRASLMAHEGVSSAHTRTAATGWPAAFTTTPLMAPTPVVSCATADVETSARRVAVITGDRRGDRFDNRSRNLKAFCQRCHMLHDRPEHQRRRLLTLRMRKAIGDLFLGPYRIV